MSHRRRSRIKHKPREYPTRLAARIADWLTMKPTGDFSGYTFHKPGSQNRKK